MGEHGYDDGLVHGHLWASEPVRRTPQRQGGMSRQDSAHGYDDAYDDGLVHNHGWARGATGGR